MNPPFLSESSRSPDRAGGPRAFEGIPQGPSALPSFPPPRRMRFRTLREEEPGPAWRAHFERLWPAYREWFLMEGAERRPSLGETVRALRLHMPELLPLHGRLASLAGGAEGPARFLGLWCPAPFLSNCSQAALGGREPALVRNYDYRPDLCEGAVMLTAWGGRRVMAVSDCTWGVLDGMNAEGLAVSLSFGGRRVLGEGFGIPVVLRYLLQAHTRTADAVAALRRIPVHMAYNVTLVDAAGEAATVFVSPDRPAVVRAEAVAANHQEAVEWPEHAAATETLEREALLREALAAPGADASTLRAAMLRPPLYATAFDRGWGTLYTAVWRPRDGSLEMAWPGGSWSLGFSDFGEREREVVFAA